MKQSLPYCQSPPPLPDGSLQEIRPLTTHWRPLFMTLLSIWGTFVGRSPGLDSPCIGQNSWYSRQYRSACESTYPIKKLSTILFVVLLLVGLLTTTVHAQTTITGTVFFDGNNDGTYTSSSEVGFGGVVVKAYDATNTEVSSATTTLSSNPLGAYTLSGLTANTTYRIEFTLPSGYKDGAQKSGSPSSVQFVKPGSTANFGVYTTGLCDPGGNIQIVAGCASINGSDVSVASWNYFTQRKSTIADNTTNPHDDDLLNTKVGIPMGIGSRKSDKLVFFSTITAQLTSVFPAAPGGASAIYVADYSATGNTYNNRYKLLTKLSALSPAIDVSAQFNVGSVDNTGEIGLGGLDLTDDGKTLYVVNMGNGKIVKLDVSAVTFSSIPSTVGYTGSSLAVSEITIPSAVASCANGRFRPSALEVYAGSLYVGGVCDASTGTSSDLKLKVLKMDLATGTWTEILNYGLSAIQGGTLQYSGWPNVKWSDTFKGLDDTDGEVQPYVNDLAIDDYGAVIIGIANRKVFSSKSNRDMGYMLRTYRKADGMMAMESAGKAGPLTSAARTSESTPGPGLNAGSAANLAMVSFGPGGDWFLEIGRVRSHPYLYNGGVYILPGTKEVVAGFTDPLDGFGYAGGRYIGFDDGVTNYGISLTDNKVFALTGLEAVCAESNIEVGNFVWEDSNKNGRQDPGEPALAGVTVKLKSSTGSTLATAVTDGSGNYIFSNASGTSTTSFIYNLTALAPLTSYSVTIDNAAGQTVLNGLALTTADITSDNEDQRDSDGSLVGANAVVAFTTEEAGANNHTLDFGFTEPPCALNVAVTPGTCNSATNQYSISGTVAFTNAVAGTVTITDGTKSTTVAVTASTTSVAYTLTGLISGSGSHTVIATMPSCGTDVVTYTAPASCTVAPCVLNLVVTPGTCNSATNQYSISGTVAFTSAVAGNLVITDGSATTTIAVTANQTSVSYTLTGFISNGSSHTVVATLTGCGSDNATYTAPASCTVCTVNLTTSTLPNGQVGTAYSRTLVTSGGTTPYTYAVSTGTLPTGLTLNPTTGVISGTPSAAATSVFSIKVTDAKSCTDVASLTIVTSALPACSVDLIVTPGTCNSATNQYSISGTVALANPTAGNLVITDGSKSTTIAVTASTTSVAYSLTGLTSGSGSHTVVATLAGCGSDNAVYSAPASCTVAPPAACAIALKPTVSGCYSVTGASKATVSVEVSWSNITVSPTDNDDSDAITVTFAGQTKIIDPGSYTSIGGNGTIVSPQVVAFEVPADASTQTAQVFIGTSYAAATCKAQKTGITLPAACPPTVCATGQTGGTIWNDFNADGIKQTGETAGVPGVTVKAYDCTGTLVGTATTDVYGRYAFTGLTAASYPIRVEFSNLPAYAGMGTLNGTDGRTTVQFVNAADCNVDLGILDPTDYCQTNPKLVIPCYVNGDPLLPISSTASAASSDAVVSFDYNTSGLMNMPLMAHATASQVGTLWGMAYNKFTKKIFSSATVKRHAGLGPLGLGGIYVTDFSTVPANGSTFNYTTFLDVSTIGINVGTIASNSARDLVEDKTLPSVDNQGYLAIGKVGIGGIDISADGNKLYLTNLFDNKLYEINITAYNTSGTLPTAANVKSYDMSTGINCTGGTLRIWAVKVHKGKIYTGMVCDAGTSQNKSDLRAFVRELNGTTVSTVFDFPLTYPKGYVIRQSNALDLTGWYPWTDDWTSKNIPGQGGIVHPEPIFSAIEFDIDGSMVLAFSDRTGFQAGFGNHNPNGDDGRKYSGYLGGDILRAYSNGVSFVLENNAKAGPNEGYGADNYQGPGFGEFYNDNWVNFKTSSRGFHAENVSGGLALRPGSGEAVVGVMDPVDYPLDGTDDVNFYYLNSGGVRHLNNETGILADSYQVYSTSQEKGTFSKAVGLGDLVLICDTPEYLEIGNRVWVDEDKDGIQDPCEKALAGVKVALYQGSTLIASTTTDANGEYYFNNNPTSSMATNVASNTAIQPNTAYTVRFGTNGTTNQYDNATGILTTSIGKFKVTTAFSTAPTANTLNDSNVQFSGGFLSAAVTTGAAGSVNHTIDAGFICAPTSVASVSVTLATCPASGTVANNDARIQLTGIACADKVFLVAAGGSIPSYTATGSQPVSASAASFTGLSNPATSAGRSYSLVLYNGPCCYTVVSTTLAQQTCLPPSLTVVVSTPICNSVTNTYTATGTVSLSNASAGTLTITNNGTSLTTISVTAGQTSATFSLSGISNGPATRTIVAALSSATATTTYVVPASCTVCTTNLVTSTLPNGQVGTAYSRTLVTSGGTTPYTYTVSTGTLPTGLSLNPTTGVISGTPTAAATSVFTIKVTDAKSCTDVQSFTIVTSALPVCSLDLIVTPGTCNSVTNQYGIAGTVTLTNPTAGNLVITDGTKSTTLTITASTTSVAYSLTGLTSGSGSHTVVASLAGCGTDNAAYTAPASCTVAPCALNVVVTPGTCNSATNQYSISGTVSLTSAVAGTMTITDGSATTTVAVSANQTSVSYTLSGLTSNGASHTVVATLAGCGSDNVIYNAPASCTVCTVNLTTSTLPNGQVGTSYSRTLVTTGGTTPYTYAVSTGTLPTGLNLNPTTGVISGTPTAAATSIFTIKVTDAKSCTDVASLTIVTSALPACVVDLIATPGACNTATNQYSTSGTVTLTNPVAGNLVITDGSSSTTVAVTTSTTTIAFTLAGLTSGSGSHTIVASLAGCGSDNVVYSAPASCTVAPPTLIVVVSTPICNSATNNYTATGTVSLTNAIAGTLTITDNGTSLTTITVTAGQTTATFSASGVSNASSHIVVATLTGGTSASATYLAPVSCTVCSLSLVTTSLPKGQVGLAYSQTITASGGAKPYSFSVSAGSLPTGLTLNPTTGVVSGTPTVSGNFPTTLVVTDAKGCAAKLILSVFEINPVVEPAIAVVVNSPVCNSATNTYVATGTVSLTNALAGSLTITDGGSPVAIINVTTGQTSANFSLTGISHGPTVQLVNVAMGTASASTTYTTPASCTAGAPAYAIAKVINQNRVEKGGIVTYTVSLTNIGNATGTNLVVGDQLSSTAVTFVGNATASVGTFLPGGNSGSWTIASLAAGQVATLSFQVQINEEGLTYNTATAPDGKTVTACLTVPFHVCANEAFEFELSAPASFSTYQWARNGVLIPGATNATYSVTAIGEYTVAATNSTGCADGSCCPVVIVADALPSLTAVGVAASCTGSTPLADASISLVGSSSTAVRYNISVGNSFTASSPLFATAQPLSGVVGGVLLANQPNPAMAPGSSYTIRVYGANGCYSDVVVVIPPAQCQCPPVKCAPFVVRKVSRR